MEIETVVEPSPLGTAGAIRFARASLQSDPVLVINGDSFADTDLCRLLERHHVAWANQRERHQVVGFRGSVGNFDVIHGSSGILAAQRLPQFNGAVGLAVAQWGIEEEVEIEAGTQSGAVLRLRGKGLPALDRSGRGDLHVTIRVRTPRSLSPEQRELIEKLADLDGVETAERGLFDRVKDIFS
jgi:hypothetical protein